MYRIGFIGCGNMGGAMLQGIVSQGIVDPSEIIVSARSQETVDAVHERYGVDVTLDNTKACRASVVFLAVKPQMYEAVIAQIAPHMDEDAVLVSIAPGKSLAWLEEKSGMRKVVRLMPNTPAAVGEGMTAVVPGDACEDADIEAVLSLVNSFGASEIVPERLIDAATAAAGCSPAFVYMFIESMADAAVAEGMARAQAYRFASQAVLGAAKMVLESGQHPGALKDAVCSPGGTTIEGVRVLEQRGMRSAVAEALIATVAKAQRL
ncbi:MAG: pyrroline-5-carboxylate reductase [Slackia sp.]|nr:pyrroline-5-carboxylate reductase [Slackia sp.]